MTPGRDNQLLELDWSIDALWFPSSRSAYTQ